MVGSGLRSTSRLAGASPEMMMDILMTNRDFLLESLQQFQSNLEKLIENIRHEDQTALKSILQQSRNARNELFEKGNT
jgi:prephenate dehydrogenase